MPLAITDYARSPRTNAIQAVALALSLLRRAPRSAPAAVRKAAKRLRDAVTELQSRRRARRNAPAKKADPRVINTALDTAWGALRDALAAVARLPRERYPASAEAQRLIDLLFPEALAFLKLEYNAVWVESDETLRAMRQDDTAAALAPLVHADLVAEVARAHKAFGDAVGMTAEVEPAAPAVDVAEALTRVQAAITSYAVQVVAAAEEADEETVTQYRHALAPIIEQRAKARKGAKAEATDDGAEEGEEETEEESGEEGTGEEGDAPANDADGAEKTEEDVARVA